MAAEKDDDGFIVVSGRKAGRRKVWKQSERVCCDETVSIARLTLKIESLIQELKQSQFYSDLKCTMTQCELLQRCREAGTPFDVVCYGLGRLSSCSTAQYQFAALTALTQDWKVGSVWVYDPVLSEDELTVVESFGCLRIPVNEVCRRAVSRPTLFFMLHCDMALYNNLLGANWRRERLGHVALLGNPLSSYHLRLPESSLKEEAYYISKCLPLCCEIAVKNSFHFKDVFNDSALHCFPQHLLEGRGEEYWEGSPEWCLHGNGDGKTCTILMAQT